MIKQGSKIMENKEILGINNLKAVLQEVAGTKADKFEHSANNLDTEGYKRRKPMINEESAFLAMQFLKNYCETYLADVNTANNSFRREEESNSNEFNNFVFRTNQTKDINVSQLLEEKESRIKKLESEEKTLFKDIRSDFKSFYSIGLKSGGIQKLFAKPLNKKIVQLQKKERLLESEIKELFNEQRKNNEELYDARIAKIRSDSAKMINNKEKNYNTQVLACQNKHMQEIDTINISYHELLQDTMNERDISTYIERLNASVPSGVAYQCRENIPKYLRLGLACMELGDKSKYSEIIDKLNTEAKKIITERNGKLYMNLPYCQTLEKGISMFLNYSPNDRKFYQEKLKMLLFKIFMSFPAGKIEATMIDPLELGETFSMFTRLGEQHARIIDTKIWSQEKDIAERIQILRQKLETTIQSYGNDKEIRLKKEPIRILAITDFPTGFNQAALQDLQAIVRKSASFGVCIFVWANSGEVGKLAENQQSVLNEIQEMLQVGNASGTYLELVTPKFKDVQLELDDMKEAFTNKDEIMDQILKGINGSKQNIEDFDAMFENIGNTQNWFKENTINEISIPIGVKGADTVVKMVLGKSGSTEHHALIAGQTGAGKSTLLHTIIMSTMLNYSYDEVEMYLVDFKEGIEFKPYSRYRLPSLRVIAIDSEREFGLNVLKELCYELERRADLFSRADCEDITDYRNSTNLKIPKIMLIFDEIQELFREKESSDNLQKECLECLNKLITQGRAMGIHIILACQDFKLVSGIEPLFSQMAIRIAIKGSEYSARSVLGSSNEGAKQLQDRDAGAAIYNGKNGLESANVVFQVSYLAKGKRTKLIENLNCYYEKIQNELPRTRVLLTNAEDGVFNVFNQLINTKMANPMFRNLSEYGLVIGEGFEVKRDFRFSMTPSKGSNLLMIGLDEKKASSLFYFSILSILHNNVAHRNSGQGAKIHLVDLSSDSVYSFSDKTDFEHLEMVFNGQIKRTKMYNMEDNISNAYDALIRRMNGEEEVKERLFFMFFGLNRAHKLINENMYDDTDFEKTALEKLNRLIEDGAKYGINVIIWGENLEGTSRIIKQNFERYFTQRVTFDTEPKISEQLVMEHNSKTLRSTTAIYMNMDTDVKNTHFRPYELPDKAWIEKFADVLQDITNRK